MEATTAATKLSSVAATDLAPTAGAHRFMQLALVLAVREFKLRYFGSVLGYVWSLLRPLMLFAVLYFVFTRVVRFGDGVTHYPVYLLMSVVFFTYFSETTDGAVKSLVSHESLIRKIRFPLGVIPVSVALTAAFNLVLNLIVVLAFMFATGVEPHWTWLELPLILAMLIASTIGISLVLAALYVRYRDLGHIWAVISQVTFYATPVIYPLEFVRDAVSWGRMDQILMIVNPLVPVVQQARHALIDPSVPGINGVLGWPLTALPFIVMAGLVAVGLWLFRREAPTVAENL